MLWLCFKFPFLYIWPYKRHLHYLRESKSYLLYLHATLKNEIHICSNKHETGLVVLIFFHSLVLQEYWVQAESRIPLMPVLGGWGRVARELLHVPLVFMNRLNKCEFAVFLYCKFSVFLKDLFFPDCMDSKWHSARNLPDDHNKTW